MVSRGGGDMDGPVHALHCVWQELQSKKEFPTDVEGSRRLIDEHTQLKKKVGQVGVTVLIVPSAFESH